MIKVDRFRAYTPAARNPQPQGRLPENPYPFFNFKQVANFLDHTSDRRGIFHQSRLTNAPQS